MAEIGGQDKPGIGFALSMERLLLALESQKIELPIEKGLDCFVVTLGDEAKTQGFKLVQAWRQAGLKVELDVLGRGLKGQLKAADRLQARYVVILGDDELDRGVVMLKTMATGEQKEYHPDEAQKIIVQSRTREGME